MMAGRPVGRLTAAAAATAHGQPQGAGGQEPEESKLSLLDLEGEAGPQHMAGHTS